MGDRTGLVRLTFRVQALSAELEELERVLNEVVAPGMCHATALLEAIQAELREMAGVERIDVQAAVRAIDKLGGEMAGGVEPAGTDPEKTAGDEQRLF
jgi:hypothetical protein